MQVASLSVFHSFFAPSLTSFLFSRHFSSISAFFIFFSLFVFAPFFLSYFFRFVFHLINYIWNKEELSEKWKESFIVPIYKKGDKIDCSNYGSRLKCRGYRIQAKAM